MASDDANTTPSWVDQLHKCIREGSPLDLSDRATVDRTIPTEQLRTALIYPPDVIDPRGLTVIGGHVTEEIDLDDATVPFPIYFQNCHFPGGLKAGSSRLHSLEITASTCGAITLVGSHIASHLTLNESALIDPNGCPLTLNGAQIAGNVTAQALSASGPIRAIAVHIKGQLGLTGAKLSALNGTALSLDLAQVDRGIIANNGFTATGEVRAIGSHIKGQLRLENATLYNPGSDALSLDGARIDGDVAANEGFTATGTIRANGIRVQGQLGLRDAKLINPDGTALHLDDAHVDGSLFVDNAIVTGEISACGAHVKGQLGLRGAKLDNFGGCALYLDDAQIDGAVFADQGFTATGEIRAINAHFKNQINLNDATITNPLGKALNLTGAHIDGDLFASNGFAATGEVRALGAHIKGQFLLRGAKLHNFRRDALTLDGAHVDGVMFADSGLAVTGRIRADDAQFKSLVLDSARVGEVDLSGATIGTLRLRPSELTKIILDNATVGALVTSPDSQPPGIIVASSFRVNHLFGAIATDWRMVRGWLSTNVQPIFDPDPWHAFADVYRQHGNPAGALGLRHAAAVRTSHNSPWWSARRLVGTIYDWVAGHGYRPLRSVIALIAVLVVTAFLISGTRDSFVPTSTAVAEAAAEAHHRQHPEDPKPEKITGVTDCYLMTAGTISYPCFTLSTSVVLAVGNTLPLPAGGSDWRTTNGVIAVLLLALRILSWVTAALLIAGLTGLLKKTD